MNCTTCGRPTLLRVCLPCQRKSTTVTPTLKTKQQPPRLCDTCDQPYHPQNKAHRYCSPRCRPIYFTPKPTRRQYGGTHQSTRKELALTVDTEGAWCTELVCLIEQETGSRWINPGEPWHLAHDRRDPTYSTYLGPAHVRCNAIEGIVYSNQVRERPVLTKTCETCGQPFETIYPRQKFCTPQHRTSARGRGQV